jgi:hypothetical protein
LEGIQTSKELQLIMKVKRVVFDLNINNKGLGNNLEKSFEMYKQTEDAMLAARTLNCVSGFVFFATSEILIQTNKSGYGKIIQTLKS